MARGDWFRNTSWTPEIEAEFDRRLRRARDKTQYLRIQAVFLAKTHPEKALELVGRYFELGNGFDEAGAHVTRAEAYLAMHDLDKALAAYEAALLREAGPGGFKTGASLDYPRLIAERNLATLFSRALNILEQRRQNLFLPIEFYLWAGAKAMIFSELGRIAEAQSFAKEALAAASIRDSGLRYHRDIGLVDATRTPFKSTCRPLWAVTICEPEVTRASPS